MIAAVADTHTAVWYLFNNPRLSASARQAIEKSFGDGNQIGVSSIPLAEMVYLVEKGRIPGNAVRDLIHSRVCGYVEAVPSQHRLATLPGVVSLAGFYAPDDKTRTRSWEPKTVV